MLNGDRKLLLAIAGTQQMLLSLAADAMTEAKTHMKGKDAPPPEMMAYINRFLSNARLQEERLRAAVDEVRSYFAEGQAPL